MTDKVGHIKNPLTIIAIFAGLAEVGGTIVLPLLQQSTQSVYVWFLMLFPTFLVGVFFWLLYNKHHVLYAPSDFRDDSTFRDVMRSALPALNVKQLEGGSKVLAIESQAAANAAAPELAPAAPPAFAAFLPQTRKVLKTLWMFQQKQFPNDTTKRWGFGVSLGSPDYMAYSNGLLELLKHSLAAVDARGFCFLSDAGIAYCQQHNADIAAETEFYGTFSN